MKKYAMNVTLINNGSSISRSDLCDDNLHWAKSKKKYFSWKVCFNLNSSFKTRKHTPFFNPTFISYQILETVSKMQQEKHLKQPEGFVE